MLDLPRNACSFLFVPATRPERIAKALASGADMVIVDWEDAVAPADKPQARALLQPLLQTLAPAQRARLLVRINAAATPWYGDDLQALAALVQQGVAGAMIPKAQAAQDLQAVAQAAGAQAVLLPLIESVAGLDAMDAIAAMPQVARLAFGNLDFQVDAGMACGLDEQELLPMRMAVVLASRRAGLAAPVDGVTVDTRDQARMAQDSERARRMGFGAKLCIHPAQVEVLHAALAPQAQAVAQARKVVQALADAGGGVCVLDGRMVDAPVRAQAQQCLRQHAWAQARQQRMQDTLTQ